MFLSIVFPLSFPFSRYFLKFFISTKENSLQLNITILRSSLVVCNKILHYIIGEKTAGMSFRTCSLFRRFYSFDRVIFCLCRNKSYSAKR